MLRQLVILLLILNTTSVLADSKAEHQNGMPEHNTNEHGRLMHGDHSAHMAMMKESHVSVSEQNYSTPNAILLDANGQSISFSSLINDEQPVVLNFIFTSCKTICPVLSNSFVQLQNEMKDAAIRPLYVSVSIDPGFDRPARLKTYGEKFDAGSDWIFLTGTDKDIVKVTKAFNAYNGSKMNHKPLTLIKIPHQKDWLRIDGLANGLELAQIYQKAL